MGFIQKLPTTLVEAFKSTLAEVVAADLILLVVDASDPNAAKEIDAVRHVLKDIGASEKRSVLVFNKMDLLDEAQTHELMTAYPDAVQISALSGMGVRGLLYRIAQEASDGDITCTVLIPYEKGMLMRMVHERCQVISERYEEGGLMATVRASERMAMTLEPYRVDREEA